MVLYKCGTENGTCQQLKMYLEVEVHQTGGAIEKTEMRIKQIEMETKKKVDQIEELKSKVRNCPCV